MSDMRVTGLAAAAAKTGASGPAAAARPQAWLLEFERARWQAQPRYEPGAADLGRPEAPHLQQQEAPEPALRRPTPQDWVASMEPAVGNEAAPTSAVLLSPFANTASAAVRALALNEASQASSAAAPHELRSAATARTAEQAHAVSRSPYPAASAAQWQARSVHVHVGEQSTAVWVRDARLLPDDAVRLLEQLRPLIIKGQDAYASIRLTVNGHAVQEKRRG